MAMTEEQFRLELAGLNRRNTELEKALAARPPLDDVLGDVDARLREKDLEIAMIRGCHELGVDERLLDGFALTSEKQVMEKVAQLAEVGNQKVTVAVNRLMNSSTLPGSGNVSPPPDRTDPATKRAYERATGRTWNPPR